MDAFNWTQASEEAAELIAEGRLTLAEIGEKVGRDPRSLWTWRQHPEFQARVEEHLSAFREEVRRRGIAVKERRIKALNDRWNRMQALLEARADDPKLANVPGGTTGLIVHNVKGVGKGEDFQLIDLYSFDAALMSSLLDHERQAAQELGQWVTKSEVEQTTKAYVTESPDTLCLPPDSDPNSEPTSRTEPPADSGETPGPR